MIALDERFGPLIEAAVGRIEARTAAEVVVVAAPRSDRYAEVAAALGGLAALLALALALYSPWTVSPLWLPLELALVGVGAAALCARSPALLAALAGTRRREARLHEAAARAFLDECVHGTRGREGLLVYLSAAEGRVLLLPDLGLEARVPPGALNALRWDTRSVEGFVAGLDALGVLLAEALPPREGPRPEGLPDAPRVRP